MTDVAVTAGPWWATESASSEACYIIYAPGQYRSDPIGTIIRPTAEQAAVDARMAAASTRLCTALEKLLDAFLALADPASEEWQVEAFPEVREAQEALFAAKGRVK